MGKPQKPTMSEHLLEEAEHRFPYYPKATYRSDSNALIQDMFQEDCQDFLDWRKTFTPRGREEEASWFFSKPGLVDQLYCLELLRSVPDIVTRTLRLAERPFAGIETGEWLVYLREAANCYILGRSNGAIALSRAAIEARLRTKASRWLGAQLDGSDLSQLLNDSRLGGLLSGDGKKRANQVRVAANDVLHKNRVTTDDDALCAVESARAVLLELSR